MFLLGPEGVSHLASQGPAAVNTRLKSFSRYENALLEHVQERMSTETAAVSGTREGSARPKPLLVSVKTFEVDAAFPTWAQSKQQLSRVFAPPHQAYRIRSRFLATRQGKKELLDYVQELRTLIAGTAVDPLPEAVTLTVSMEGLRTSVARTEVFRVHPSSFEEAVSVALNAEHNFRSARPGWYAGSAGSSSGPEPMNLSYADGEEAELLAAEQRTSIRRCFTCGSTRHLRVSCPVRNQRKAPPNQASGSSRGNGDSK
ncbi:hypothetical protein PC128_g22613 [Phytophthora cactorum]|nr:hypothetical protein PC128_g22613 [Phytophthora cactorum]